MLRVFSLRSKLLATYGLLILVTMGLSAGYFLYDSDRFYLQQATTDLQTQSYLLALQARPLLATHDRAALGTLLRDVNAGTRARFLIFDEHGTVLAVSEAEDDPLIGTTPALPGTADALAGQQTSGRRTQPENAQEVLYSTMPVHDAGSGDLLGVVRDSYALADLHAFERETLRRFLLASALASAAAALCGVFFADSIIRPLRAVRDTVNQLATGHLEARVALDQRDEVGRVAADVNALGARLAKLERQRREFTAEVSHDLRGLAAGIALTARVLRQIGPEHEARALQLLQALTVQTARLARLTDELLLVASTEAAENPPALRPASLDSLVADVVAEMRPLAAARDTALDYQRPPDPVGARVDAPLFTRAVANLLDNAITHTPTGGRITVRLGTQGARAMLTIADTGPGIGAAAQAHLFARHNQGEGDPTRGGHGLGLAIVRRVAAAHDGEIQVESTARGTTITLLLPSCPPPPGH